jgi:hypothetical protein
VASPDELGVRLVEHDRRRAPGLTRGIADQGLEQRRDDAVGLSTAGRVVRVAEPDDVGRSRGRADRGDAYLMLPVGNT